MPQHPESRLTASLFPAGTRRKVAREIDIAAAPETVWAVLMDFAQYPSWNPFIERISGETHAGGRLEAFIKPIGSKGMTFKPRILVSRPQQEFRWRGAVGAEWLFAGEHVFRLMPISPGHTRFVQAEAFTGLLAPLLATASFLETTRKSFDLMNAALRDRAEHAAKRHKPTMA
jgi:hypothetical protein